MALKADFVKTEQNFDGFLVAKDAYWRVDKVSGNKVKCMVTVVAYEKQDNAIIGLKEFYFSPAMDGGNFVAQAYAYLKTLPEFAGAIDC